jgi:hypothetical protein
MKSNAPIGYALVGTIAFCLFVEALVFSLLLLLPELLASQGGFN